MHSLRDWHLLCVSTFRSWWVMLTHLSFALVTAILLAACSTAGMLGIVTKSSADPASLLRSGRGFQELGPAEGSACRHFVLAIIPFGASDFSKAVDKALEQRGGDALINVVAQSSLYGFIPYWNLYSFTCTTVKGTAIKFKQVESALTGTEAS
jgi:hypothetical protein